MAKTDPETVIPLKIANADEAVRHVFIRDLRLDAHIGVFRHEEGRTQPIRINIDLTVSDAGGQQGDRLEDVVDYHQVVEAVKEMPRPPASGWKLNASNTAAST
jgi:dihydroneopterin aldolase